jgi:hypothetical protein
MVAGGPLLRCHTQSAILALAFTVAFTDLFQIGAPTMNLERSFRESVIRAHHLTVGKTWNVGLKGAWALAVSLALAVLLYLRSFVGNFCGGRTEQRTRHQGDPGCLGTPMTVHQPESMKDSLVFAKSSVRPFKDHDCQNTLVEFEVAVALRHASRDEALNVPSVNRPHVLPSESCLQPFQGAPRA